MLQHLWYDRRDRFFAVCGIRGVHHGISGQSSVLYIDRTGVAEPKVRQGIIAARHSTNSERKIPGRKSYARESHFQH